MGYKTLENQMRSVISSLPQEKIFFLWDIIPNPPAQLGRTLFQEVQSGIIPNVQYIAKVDSVEQYKKL